MKKTNVILTGRTASAAGGEAKGRIEVYDMATFALHVYYTNDVMADAAFIVEGREAVVTMEQPLFKDNVAEFDAYLNSLGKPVAARIADYHLGGTGDAPIVMPAGMPAFTSGGAYAAMMEGFARSFGDTIVSLPTGERSEAAFDSTVEYAGVTFAFRRGAATDFPGAALLIGGKVWYSHWAPVRAHVSPLYVASATAIAAQLAATEEALASGAELFVGGHGGAATTDDVRFHIAYLKKMQALRASCPTATAFQTALKVAFTDLPGAEGVEALSNALYGGV